MIKPILKTPYKARPIPKLRELIYFNSQNTVYSMVDTQKGKLIGNMCAYPVKGSNICGYNLKPSESAFHINSLYINPEYRNQGWGGKLIKYAEAESPKHGCEGRVFLTAFNYQNSPHAFYYKLGYRCEDARINKQLDDCVKFGIRPHHWEALDMFLPLETSVKTCENKHPEQNFIQKLTDFIKKLFQ